MVAGRPCHEPRRWASKTRPGACGTRLTQQDLQGAQEAGVAGPRLSPSQPSQRVDTDGGLTEAGVVQATVKKKRRYKPGTVALREIRKCEANLTHRSGHTHCLASFTV